MGRLSEYDDSDWREAEEQEDYAQHEQLKANARDEYLVRAYIDGRNAARDNKSRNDIPDIYVSDSLAAVNWEVGYDDKRSEIEDGGQ